MPSPKTIALAAALRDRVEDLLDTYANATGHVFGAPAEALTGLIRHLGWGLKFERLPEDRFAECVRERRLIRVTADLADRLEYPEQVRAYCHKTLAHELGHAVLHSAPRRSRAIPSRWEWEANVFAQVFLVPWRLVADRPEIRSLRGNMLTQKERWREICRLADTCQVTPSFMRGCLVLYGVLLPSTASGGIEAPSDVLISPARPWKVA